MKLFLMLTVIISNLAACAYIGKAEPMCLAEFYYQSNWITVKVEKVQGSNALIDSSYFSGWVSKRGLRRASCIL